MGKKDEDAVYYGIEVVYVLLFTGLITSLSTFCPQLMMLAKLTSCKGRKNQQQMAHLQSVATYNHHMNGVDLSNQMLSHHVLMRCMRWWKTLFFYVIDSAVVNSYFIPAAQES